MVHLNLDNFADEVLSRPGKVIVEFFLITCKACADNFRVLAEFEQDHPEIGICALNLGEFPSIGSALEVTAAPTLLLFEDGVVVDRLFGATTKRKLDEFVAQ